MTLGELAMRFGLDLDRVRAWQQGDASPDGAVQLLLAVIQHSPDVVDRAMTVEPAAPNGNPGSDATTIFDGLVSMDVVRLSALYRNYIACLNARDWTRLGDFVHADAEHNGRPLGLAGYQAMLEEDFRQIPDLRFAIDLLVVEPPHVASRLRFDCAPRGRFLGLDVDGRRVTFCENVFYTYQDGRIAAVWSIIDKAAIEAQL